MKYKTLIFIGLGYIFLSASPYPHTVHPIVTTTTTCSCSQPEWGFFGHKRINRLAALTLPPQMQRFFKKNIDFLTDHAVDPDMRRYAVSWEGPRHFIDLDEYGEDVSALPRTWPEALMQYCQLYGVNAAGDTLLIFDKATTLLTVKQPAWRYYFATQVARQFSTEEHLLDIDSLRAFSVRQALNLPEITTAFFKEDLSAHGILPWNLQQMQRRLTNAFRDHDAALVLKISAELGHYVGDAHVPLHTTSNYNGQKTGQYGIHGFWESRIPELFADETYDYFVGKPVPFTDPALHYWDIVLSSHDLVDSVLQIEQRLRNTFPADQQVCPDIRLGVQVLSPCRDYAEAYQNAMRGMVERRMRAAIQSVASAWLTAWMDAGQPDMRNWTPKTTAQTEEQEAETIKKKFSTGKIIGREE